MIKITFYKNKIGDLTGFEISGHAGFSNSGKDIVCAAVSSISQATCLGVTKVVKLPATIKKDDKKGFLQLKLPKNLDGRQNEITQVLLSTMQISIEDLLFDYKNYIQMEVKHEVY